MAVFAGLLAAGVLAAAIEGTPEAPAPTVASGEIYDVVEADTDLDRVLHLHGPVPTQVHAELAGTRISARLARPSPGDEDRRWVLFTAVGRAAPVANVPTVPRAVPAPRVAPTLRDPEADPKWLRRDRRLTAGTAVAAVGFAGATLGLIALGLIAQTGSRLPPLEGESQQPLNIPALVLAVVGIGLAAIPVTVIAVVRHKRF
jgi:hypothetical protein